MVGYRLVNTVTLILVIVFNLSAVDSLNDVSGQAGSPVITVTADYAPSLCARESLTNVSFTVKVDMTNVDTSLWQSRVAVKLESTSTQITELTAGYINACPSTASAIFKCVSKTNDSYELKYKQISQGSYSYRGINFYMVSTDYQDITQSEYTKYPYVKEALYPVLHLNGFELDINISASTQEIELVENITNVPVKFTMLNLEVTNFTFTLMKLIVDVNGNETVLDSRSKTDRTWMIMNVSKDQCVDASYIIHDNQLTKDCADRKWRFCFFAIPTPSPPGPPCPCGLLCIILIIIGCIIVIIIIVTVIYLWRRRQKRQINLDVPRECTVGRLTEHAKLKEIINKCKANSVEVYDYTQESKKTCANIRMLCIEKTVKMESHETMDSILDISSTQMLKLIMDPIMKSDVLRVHILFIELLSQKEPPPDYPQHEMDNMKNQGISPTDTTPLPAIDTTDSAPTRDKKRERREKMVNANGSTPKDNGDGLINNAYADNENSPPSSNRSHSPGRPLHDVRIHPEKKGNITEAKSNPYTSQKNHINTSASNMAPLPIKSNFATTTPPGTKPQRALPPLRGGKNPTQVAKDEKL